MAEIHLFAQSAFYALAGGLATSGVQAWIACLVPGTAGGALAWRLAEHYEAALAQGAAADRHTAARALRASLARGDWRGRDVVAGGFGLGLSYLCVAVHGVPGGLPVLAACVLLLWLACIDACTGLLPDALTAPLFTLGLCVGPMAGWSSLLAAALIYGCAAGLGAAYRHVQGREGMGSGDLKLMAALAAWTGPLALCWIVLTACLAGLAWAMCSQRTPLPRGAYPFGPFLSGAAAPVLVAGTAVQSWF